MPSISPAVPHCSDGGRPIETIYSDGDSDGADFLVWQRNYGASVGLAASVTVPEPGTMGLIALATFITTVFGQRRAGHVSGRRFSLKKDLVSVYGSIMEGFIHVHHVIPLSSLGDDYVVSSDDLRPVCPNCHAAIHRKDPPYTLDEVRSFIRRVEHAVE